VVADGERFVLVDGYTRVEALRELGRDLVEAVLLDVPEAEALILAHRLEAKRRRSALEEGWLIAELTAHHGLGQRAIATRLQRSVSWVSRRLSLVKVLPESVQGAVKRGLLPPHAAMKFLAPLARANKAQCEELVAALGNEVATDRQMERIYLGWKRADGPTRERIVQQPRLYLQAEGACRAQPVVPEGDPAFPLIGDLDAIAGLARRAKRRVGEGLMHELDEPRKTLVMRSQQAARLAFDNLSDLLRYPV
jgi:ParB family chromosome partitioning protein